jgi:hypothetical protein
LSERLFDELGRPVRRTAAAVRHIEVHNTAPLLAGLAEHNDFTVPVSRSWLGRHGISRVEAVPGATAGTHFLQGMIVGALAVTFMWSSGAHNAVLTVDANILQAALASGRILRLTYNNSTNAPQTNVRNWHIIVIEEVS